MSESPSLPPFENHPSFPIAIVGGGLGGLALAVGLTKQGVNVHIYEAAGRFATVGAGLSLGPNGTRALNLIDPALLEGYKKHATFNLDPKHSNSVFSWRWGMDERMSEKGGNGRKTGDLMFHFEDRKPELFAELGVKTRSSIHRARFLEVLAALLPEGIVSFGKAFQKLKEKSDGTFELYFADGTTASASAVIGCDGVRSRVRQYVCGSGVQPAYTGEQAYRALVPKAAAGEILGEERSHNGQLYCGYGAHVVTYPVEHGNYINMVAIAHESSDVSKQSQPWTVPSCKKRFARTFEGWSPHLIQLMSDHLLPDVWSMFDLQHSSRYYKGRICLLGDSAHASTPYLAAGAGMAMEDAFILSRLVTSIEGVSDMEKAFSAYDAVRRPRTQTLVEYSRKAGLANDFLSTCGHDVKSILRGFEEWLPWTWHEDLEAQLATARRLL